MKEENKYYRKLVALTVSDRNGELNSSSFIPCIGFAVCRAVWMLLWHHFSWDLGRAAFHPLHWFCYRGALFSLQTLRNPKTGVGWGRWSCSCRRDTMANKQLYYRVLLSVRFVSASKAVSAGMDCPAGGKDSGRVWVWVICAAFIISPLA